MPRPGTIGRLMGSVGLIGLALGLLRGWLGPVNFLGFLAPMVLLVLLGLALMLPTAGRIRRFFRGMVATGSCIGLAILVAPEMILGVSYEITSPVDDLWIERGENRYYRWLIETKLISLWWKDFDWFTHRGLHFQAHSPHLQAFLAIPQLVLASIGGWIDLALGSRRTPGRPEDGVTPIVLHDADADTPESL